MKSMADVVYDYMDWAEIEAVTFSEESAPRSILGPRPVKEGILVQAFFPGRSRADIRTPDGKLTPMYLEDESGFFAGIIPAGKNGRIPRYRFVLYDAEGMADEEFADAYAFPCQITDKEEKKFQEGSWYDAAETLGAHVRTVHGVSGTYFAVWAPNAVRVSVVGDFNHWDGRYLQMNRTGSGIFELFVPGVGEGALYKYELKLKTGLVYLKADPYAAQSQEMPENASVIREPAYGWQDDAWMEKRKQAGSSTAAPVAVYEVHLGSWQKKADGTPCGYRELAQELPAYVGKMGFTHVELTPVMEYPDDASLGYATSGYFAPTSRYGSPEDFMSLVDAFHQEGIAVILDWVPAFFARGNEGLSSFDGTCLYEHLDPRQGVHPKYNTLIFNYGRKEVVGFLLSSALFWLKKYHADGLRINDVASMLYLDYGRPAGGWVANRYGGNENLEAEEFLQKLNTVIAKECPGTVTVAEENTGWPLVTGPVREQGLGFTYKWNNGCLDDYMNYIQLDPLFRGQHQDSLTFSMAYMYSEKFMLSLDHSRVQEEGAYLKLMPGYRESLKMANLRLTLAYMTVHPGKKLLFMGTEFGQSARWNPEEQLDWKECTEPLHAAVQDCTRALLQLYRSQPALYEEDFSADGFEWIDNLDWQRNLLIFLRKSRDGKNTLLAVCNFSNVEYDDFRVGVPKAGKYKEIFNSDALAFGGSGAVNPRVKASRPVEAHERENSIKVKIPPLGVSVFALRENG